MSDYMFSPMKTRYKIWHKRFPIICEIWASNSGAFKDSSLLGCWHSVTGWVVPDVVSHRSVFYLQVQSVQEGLFDRLLQNGRNFLPSDTSSQIRRPTSLHRCWHNFWKFCSKVFIFTFPDIFLPVVCFLLGYSPASEFCVPTFRNTLSVPSS